MIISKRTKHKWMRWTTKGLEAMLNLVLTRYVSEESYQKFKHEIVKGENLKLIMVKFKSLTQLE